MFALLGRNLGSRAGGARAIRRGLVVVSCLALSGVALLACRTGAFADSAAQLSVEILSPADGSSVPNRSDAVWTAGEAASAVPYSEYVLDPPSAFTSDEVLHPEFFPAISIRFLPDPGGIHDTLRVSKMVGDTVLSFDWVKTPDTTRAFVFSVPNPDSELVSATLVPLGRYSGGHRLYVRVPSADSLYEGAWSDFVAVDRTPVTTLTRPWTPGRDIYAVGSGDYQVDWGGTDPDTPGSPVGYLYKLVDLSQVKPSPRIDHAGLSYIYESSSPWVYQGAGTTQVILSLRYGDNYMFGVRGVDADGAVEPLDLERNVFKAVVAPNQGYPVLGIKDRTMADVSVTGIASPAHRDVAFGVPLHLQVSCDASLYGGACDAVRWGVDLGDPDGDEGWSTWSDQYALPPIDFTDPGEHLVYVEVRDDVGAVSRATLDLNVLSMSFDRSVLWVDDFKNENSPYYASSDAVVDAFWRGLIDNSGRFGAAPEDSVWAYNCYGLNDVSHLPPIPPDLEFLGHFKLVIWYANFGYGGESALYQSTGYVPQNLSLSPNRNLLAYLAAGGQLWVVGSETAPDMMRGDTSAPSNYPLAPSAGDFAYDFMKLASPRIENALAGYRSGPEKTSANDNLIGVDPFPGRPAIYPAMVQDSTRWNPFAKSIPFADAVFDPIQAGDIPGFTGIIDSLYVYRAKSTSSTYDNRLTAIRWHDPNPNPSQGAVQWFGFDLWPMKTAQAQEVFNRSIDWFRSLEHSVPVRLSAFTVARSAEGAVVRWSVAEATDHAGFDVYRQVAGGERVKLNDRLLSGSADYTFVDAQAPAGAATYWLAELSRTGGTTWLGPVSLPAAEARFAIAMGPAAPNPFREATRVAYTLPRATPVRVDVFDVQGRRVATLVDGTEQAGAHEASWDGRLATGARAAAGFYLIRLRAGDVNLVRRALLLK